MLCTTVPGIFFVCLEKGSLYRQCQSWPPVCCSRWQMAVVYPGFTSATFLLLCSCAVIQERSSNARLPKAHSPLVLLRLAESGWSSPPYSQQSSPRRCGESLSFFCNPRKIPRTKILRFFSSAARYVRSRTSKDTNCASGADIDVHGCRCDVSTCKCEELLRARNLDIFVVGRADFDVFHVHTIVAIREDNFHQTRHFRVESAVGDFECEY